MVYYKSDDGRRLEQTDFGFGDYDISYVQCSHGDVIRGFYDGKRLSVLLADTLGHDKEIGDGFATFLDAKRKDGWGVGSDPEAELSKLSASLERDDATYLPTSKWHPVGSLLSIEGGSNLENIAFAGTERPLHVMKHGHVYIPELYGNLEFYDSVPHSPSYDPGMRPGDVLVLMTDGLRDNMEAHGHGDAYDTIIDFLEDNRHNDADFIASRMTDPGGFGYMVLPWDEKDDDISLIVVKKK